jgi:hypothetical protein
MAQDPTPSPRALDLATSSSDDLVEDRRAVFGRLLGYVKPLKGRFIWGIFFGILAGVFNGFLLLVLKSVFVIVLPASQGEEIQKVYRPFEDLHLPALAQIEFPPRICRRTRNGSSC